MKETITREGDFDSSNILNVIYKWRKPFVVIAIVAVVLSAIASLFIQDKYKSTVVLFPTVTNSTSRPLLSEIYQGKDLFAFGEEEQAEQMLQILNSDEIRDKICDKYNLMEHYRISPKGKYKQTSLYDEYRGNVTFKRTEYMSVKIEVMDVDSKMAADIANDISAFYDSVKTNIQRQRTSKAFQIVEKEYLSQLKMVNEMTDSIKALNNHGVYDYESQSERTIQQYNIELAKGDQRAIKTLEGKLNILATYGSSYVFFRENLRFQRERLVILQNRYAETKVDLEQDMPQKFVVNSAFPAERASYPIRWIIVVISTLATLLATILVIFLIENVQKRKQT